MRPQKCTDSGRDRGQRPSVCPTRSRVPVADRAAPGRTGQTPHIHAGSPRRLRSQKVSPARSSLTAPRGRPPTRGSQCGTSSENQPNRRQPELSGRVCETRGGSVVTAAQLLTGSVTQHTERTLTRNATAKGEAGLCFKRLPNTARATRVGRERPLCALGRSTAANRRHSVCGCPAAG